MAILGSYSLTRNLTSEHYGNDANFFAKSSIGNLDNHIYLETRNEDKEQVEHE